MVTVDVPCVAPNHFPQSVTKTPLPLAPPLLGPLSRSVKKILGGALCAIADNESTHIRIANWVNFVMVDRLSENFLIVIKSFITTSVTEFMNCSFRICVMGLAPPPWLDSRSRFLRLT
jgi:hypothetical protein